MVRVRSWMSTGTFEFGLENEVGFGDELGLELEVDMKAVVGKEAELGLQVAVAKEAGAVVEIAVGKEVELGPEVGIGNEVELAKEMQAETKVQHNCCKECSLGPLSKAGDCEGNLEHWKETVEIHFGLRLKEVSKESEVTMGWLTKSGSKDQSCLDLA